MEYYETRRQGQVLVDTILSTSNDISCKIKQIHQYYHEIQEIDQKISNFLTSKSSLLSSPSTATSFNQFLNQQTDLINKKEMQQSEAIQALRDNMALHQLVDMKPDTIIDLPSHSAYVIYQMGIHQIYISVIISLENIEEREDGSKFKQVIPLGSNANEDSQVNANQTELKELINSTILSLQQLKPGEMIDQNTQHQLFK